MVAEAVKKWGAIDLEAQKIGAQNFKEIVKIPPPIGPNLRSSYNNAYVEQFKPKIWPGSNPDDPCANPDDPWANPDDPWANPDDPWANPDDPVG